MPLGTIAEVKLGKMLDKTKHVTGQRMPYLRNINVRWGAIDADDLLEMYFEDDELERYGLKAGDVLVCEGGEPGRAAVWNGRLSDLKYQKALHRVRFREPYEPSLFVYLLELLAKIGGLAPRFTGSTIKHFTREALVELPIPVPPLDEQREIVAETEKQFTRLDAGVAGLRRVQANLKRYRAAVLKGACEGRLVPTEAELTRERKKVAAASRRCGSKENQSRDGFATQEGAGYETGDQLLERILTERRQKWNGKGKYKESVKPDTAGLPTLPQGWVWSGLDQICTKITDGEHLSPKTVSNGVVLLSAKDVREHGVQLDDPKFVCAKDAEQFRKRCDPELGDVLAVSRGATIGRITVVQTNETFCLMGSVILLKSDKNALGKYLAFCLRDQRAKDRLGIISGSTAQQAIYIRDIRTFPIPFPPIAEQQRIVAEVERRLSVIEELEAVVNANLHRATRMRQSILQRAFAGKLINSH